MSFPGLQPGMSVVVHREGYAACFKLPVHNFWEYLPRSSPDEIAAGLAMDHLEPGTIGAIWLCSPQDCRCRLSDFSYVGHPFAPEEDFVEEQGSWLLSLSGGDGDGLRGLSFIDPSTASGSNLTAIDDDTTSAAVSAGFADRGPRTVMADAVLDWSTLTRDGWGQPLEPHRLDRARLDAVELSSDDLSTRLLDLDALVIQRYEADIEGSTRLPLDALLAGDELSADRGVTWLFSLWCTTCSLDLPRVGVLVAPAP